MKDTLQLGNKHSFVITGKYSNLKPIVGPRGPLHGAQLDVEGELLHVDVAHGHVDAVTEPRHFARVPHYDVCVDDCRAVVWVGTETKISLLEV